MPEAYVKQDHHQGITTIEFFHPQSNSLPGNMLNSLANAFIHAGEDPNTKLIILRSEGKTFCAGASFEELSSIQTEEQGLVFFSGFAKVINAMRTCPKLIIGRIHGKCVGGGVGVAAALDYAIATEAAEIKLSELAVGIGPFVVGPAVERKIGVSAFSQLAIDASRWRSAEWARRKGLFAELYTNDEELDEAIGRLSQSLVQSSPEAMAEIKKIAWAGTENWGNLLIERAAISGRLVLSEFTRNAIQRFKTK
jgi:methylglutaconyl-CoA hydratase